MELPRVVTERLNELAPVGVKFDEPMSRHTSFGLGGPADVLIDAPDETAFKSCAAFLADEGIPSRVLGRGTNVLVRRGGIDGAVLVAGRALGELERDGNAVTAGSGVPLARLLSFCADEGLAGLEGLAGIPGSVGGAVVMNAGSHGVAIGERLTSVVTFKPGGSSSVLPADALEFGYRSTSLPAGAIVERVSLELDEGAPEAIRTSQREMLDRKWREQPCGMRSAGCIFKNTAEASAGLLIDGSGLKGTRVGGAVVSDQHANFIVNDRGATADDVEKLIELVRGRVADDTGVELELEIEIIGRRAN
ncbi:MAG: UDP-N-acetylmuramate dehydrogenase [Candidatus Eisenbacteria bacterium]